MSLTKQQKLERFDRLITLYTRLQLFWQGEYLFGTREPSTAFAQLVDVGTILNNLRVRRAQVNVID